MRAGRASIAIASWLASGCGDGGCGDTASRATADAVEVDAPGPGEVASGDPLLTRARASIAGGRIDPQLVAELRASSDPAHARAARLLAAFAGETAAPAGRAPDEERAPVGPPPVVPPADLDPGETGETAETAGPSGDAERGTIATSSTAARDPAPASPKATPRVKKPRAELSALNLQSTDGGATLTIKAPGGVTVGVANQPSSGIVRLVIEGASATPKVAGARPKIAGARVTGVRKGQDTVQITLQLDPGWRLGGVKSFSGGARVKLVAP